MKNPTITPRHLVAALGLFLPAPAVFAADLVHQWNFNENAGTSAANSVSGGPSATLMGGATFDGSGGVTLNGSSGTYISLGSGTLNGLTSVTFEGWVSDNGANNTHLFSFDDSPWGTYLRFNLGDSGNGHNGNSFIEPIVGWGGAVLNGTPVADNTLNHIVVIYDPANNYEAIYVNGALTASYTGTLNALSNYATVAGRLGRSPWADYGDPFLNGTINQFSIYNGALTGTEIAALYAAGPIVPDPSDNDGDGLPAVWETAHGLDDSDDGTINPDNGPNGDPDDDTFSNLAEYTAGSDPQDTASTPDDIDGDGLEDAWEQLNFGNLGQTGTGDPDGDYATNEEEETASTLPNVRVSAPDSEPDGMGDAWEIHFFGDTTTATDVSDSDNDGISDVDEFANNTNPDNILDPLSGTNIITWSTPATITADSQILTSGTLIHAGNFRSDDSNVDVTLGSGTITFENRQSQDGAGTLQTGEEARVIAGAGGRQVNGGLFDATGTTVSAAFESVLDGSAWENADLGPAPGATDMILRVTGSNGDPLVTGQQYQIQLFYSDDRGGNTGRGQIFHDDAVGGNQSAAMLAGDSMAVTGTFTADSSGYQDVFIQNSTGGDNFPVALNAYVLRTVPSSNDTDSDGMDDTWETTYGLSVGTNDSAADLDGDGTDNLTEYRLGLTPNSGSSRFAATRSAAGLLEWPSVTGVTFTVQRSDNLTGWSNIATVPGTAGTASYTDPAPPSGKAFYRVLLEP